MALAHVYVRKSTNTRNQNVRQIVDRDTLLVHRIALAQGDGVTKRRIFFAERFEIDCDAEWSPNFILASISPADRPRLIVKNKHVRPKKIDNLFGLRDQRFL